MAQGLRPIQFPIVVPRSISRSGMGAVRKKFHGLRRLTDALKSALAKILVALSLVASEMAYGQADSSKPDFFPYHLGDTWVYYVQNGAGDDTLQVTIIADSTDGLGNAYLHHKIETLNPREPAINYPWYEFYKVDTAGNIYSSAFYSSNDPYPRFQYNAHAQLGESWLVDSVDYETARLSQIFASSVFGVTTTIKNIAHYTSILIYGENYANGFGITYRGGGDLGYALYLLAAIIGGKKYGDTTLTSVAYTHSRTPVGLAQLFPNYPNPFNGQTTIKYVIPRGGDVTLSVYDVLGRVVGRLVNGFQESGQHVVTFGSGGLASGVYFYRLEIKGVLRVGKMLLQK